MADAESRRQQSSRPTPPTNCCGDGCARCVWDVYYEDLAAFESESTASGGHQPTESSVEVVRRFRADKLQSLEDLYAAKHIELLPVVHSRYLVDRSHSRPVIEVQVNMSKNGRGYELGDHILIHAPNPPQLVAALGRRLGYPPDSILDIQRKTPEAGSTDWLPTTCVTSEHLLSHLVDLTSSSMLRSPRMLHFLSAHTRDAPDREALTQYADQRTPLPPQHTHSLLALLAAFPSCQPPLGGLLERLKPLVPRCFSAATSPLAHPSVFGFVFAVAGDLHAAASDRPGGLCTSWLQTTLDPTADPQRPLALPASWPKVRSAVFTLPADPSRPMILCATGSGIAPFIAMLEHRSVLQQRGVHLGPCILLYGCYSEEEVLYHEQLNRWLEDKVITHLSIALSHPTGPGTPQYVWHLMPPLSQQLLEAMDSGACFYVCGSVAMQADVKHTWETLTGSVTFVDDCHRRNQYVTEAWT